MALDYYAVLGVKKNASADELRKAYKKLSRENHPDRKPNDASASEKFKQVQEGGTCSAMRRSGNSTISSVRYLGRTGRSFNRGSGEARGAGRLSRNVWWQRRSE